MTSFAWLCFLSASVMLTRKVKPHHFARRLWQLPVHSGWPHSPAQAVLGEQMTWVLVTDPSPIMSKDYSQSFIRTIRWRMCFWFTCMRAKLLQSSLTLCHPMDCSSPGSSVHGILQVRVLEWVAISPSRGSFQPRYQTHICIVRQILYLCATWEALCQLLNFYY